MQYNSFELACGFKGMLDDWRFFDNSGIRANLYLMA